MIKEVEIVAQLNDSRDDVDAVLGQRHVHALDKTQKGGHKQMSTVCRAKEDSIYY